MAQSRIPRAWIWILLAAFLALAVYRSWTIVPIVLRAVRSAVH